MPLLSQLLGNVFWMENVLYGILTSNIRPDFPLKKKTDVYRRVRLYEPG